jgi:hypothetical protein
MNVDILFHFSIPSPSTSLTTLRYNTPYTTTYHLDKEFCRLGTCAVIVPGTLSNRLHNTATSLTYCQNKEATRAPPHFPQKKSPMNHRGNHPARVRFYCPALITLWYSCCNG